MSSTDFPGSWSPSRALVLLAGLGMAAFSALTMQHFFAANYPVSIFEGSFCDINAFFNCNSSAYSPISAVAGVPIGWFGMALGGLVALGALFPSPALERTTRTLSMLNVVGVIALLVYSVAVLGSLCLLCSGYYVFSFLALAALWPRERRRGAPSNVSRSWLRPASLHLVVFAAAALLGAWGVHEYHGARREAQSGGVAARIVGQFYSLPIVSWPSVLSPFWSVRSTQRFEDAPIRVVEYGDPLCIDCQLLHRQMKRLAEEFAGQLNVAYQFFPLEAACNDVVDKDKHPGACEMSYMLAAAPDEFPAMLDEVYENMQAAKSPEWRADFAARWGCAPGVGEPAVQAQVKELLRTGTEYGRTSEQYAFGIRSTPTMIINNRMVIGTLPYEQLRAIFRALVDEHERGDAGFLESWERTGS